MKQIKSLSTKRIIVTAKLNGMNANFLIDTGATVAILSDTIKRKYKLSVGRTYHLPVVGAGGDFDAKYCNTPAYIEDKPLTQFLIADISNIVDSVERETGIEIQGIISLPQMQFAGIRIDTRNNTIIID